MILDQPNVYKADIREFLRSAKTKGQRTRILNQERDHYQAAIDCLEGQFKTGRAQLYAYFSGDKYDHRDLVTLKLYLVAIEDLRSELPVNTVKETV